MAALYCAVMRSNVVLAKYSQVGGNFASFVEGLLPEVEEAGDRPASFTTGRYTLHTLPAEGLLCVVLCDGRQGDALRLLQRIRDRFLLAHRDRASSALPYGMQTDFSSVIANEIAAYNAQLTRALTGGNVSYGAVDGPSSRAKVAQVHADLEAAREIFAKNIDTITARGERLELLVDRSAALDSSSTHFRAGSASLARSFWWKNVRLWALAILIVGLLTLLFALGVCRGSFSNCRNS